MGLNIIHTLFETTLRVKIAYISAAILVLGALILLISRRKSQEKPAPIIEYNETGAIKNNKTQSMLFIAILIVFLFWAPYAFQGQNVHVRIFDNLDCHVPQTKVLAESGKAFSLNPNTQLDNFINGIRLSGVDSGYNVMTWLYILFPAFTAYALNDLLVRLIALLGMLLFLRRYIVKPGEEHTQWVITGVSLCFSLLPFYPAGGISIAGIPILLYAFLNILNRKWKMTDFLIIFAYPFYSKLALAGVFVVAALGIIFLIDIIRKRKINFVYFWGLALLTITYCFTQFHLVYSFLDPNFESFREEIRPVGLDFFKAFTDAIDDFIFDNVNEVGAQHLFVIGAAALAVIMSIIKKINLRIRFMAGLVIICLATALMWGFKYWKGIMPLREKYQVINAFDFSRFYWLNPFIWYLIFALALLVISKIKYGKQIASFFIIAQILFMFSAYNWEYRSMLGIKNSYAGSPITYSLTYKQFFSEALFDQIAQFINIPKKDYRVVSLGIHPGISQYNGFYTLDIYTDVYPMRYKHQFEKIMEKELEKSDELKQGFESNAKRCFLMSNELHGNKAIRGMMFSRGITKDEPIKKIDNLAFNASAFKEMGGQYIFSAVKISNAEETGLTLEGVFKTSDSPWRIFLYKAK